MGDHRGLVRMGAGIVMQLRKKRFDLALDLSAARARLSHEQGRIQPPFQFHQPPALALKAPIGRSKSAMALHDGYELCQQRMPPFC